MDAKGVMRGLGWSVAALAGVVAVGYGLLVLVNWNDEPASAEAQRLAALVHGRPALADAANGYVHLLGLAAAPDVDPVGLGSARKAFVEAPTPRLDADAMVPPGRTRDFRAERSGRVAALARACADAVPCEDAAAADPDAVAQWLASERWLLDRYDRMLATEAWQEALPGHVTSPLLVGTEALDAQRLHLLAARERARAGDVAGVRDVLDRDLVFWRRVLASTDLLVTKMIAVAAVNRHFASGNLVLRALPPGESAAAVPPSWQRPLAVHERSLTRTLGGELHYIGRALETVASDDAGGAGRDWRLVDRLQRPLFQRQATLNLFAARMARTGAVSELPYEEIGPALARLDRPDAAPSRWVRAYNVLGHVLDATTPASAYAQYVARTVDIEGHRRAALLVATLRGAGVTLDGMAAAVRDAPLRSPVDGDAFDWDPAEGVVVFNGLAEAGRGRHAVLF